MPNLIIPSLSSLAAAIMSKVSLRLKRKGFGSTSPTGDDSITANADTEKLVNDPMVKYTVNEQDRIKSLYSEIIMVMKEDCLYRDKDLTIDSLAIILNTNNTYISNAINKVGHTSYSKLINSYRITEVIQLMEENGRSLTNREIADKVGYRDLTTFYRHFKEITGCTPTEYINSPRQT